VSDNHSEINVVAVKPRLFQKFIDQSLNCWQVDCINVASAPDWLILLVLVWLALETGTMTG